MKQFGITDFTVHYAQENRKDCDAAIAIDFENRGLTFVLPTTLEDTARKTIDNSALHEVCHAALAHFDWVANQRFVSESEVTVVCEATVCRLTTLVSNLSKPRRSRG